jgi:hypothetical protein
MIISTARRRIPFKFENWFDPSLERGMLRILKNLNFILSQTNKTGAMFRPLMESNLLTSDGAWKK